MGGKKGENIGICFAGAMVKKERREFAVDIKKQLENLPKSPGVYKFLDKQKQILYIGKATSLKDRVSSYFSRSLDNRLQSMVAQISKIDYEKTDSVLEALILEANLIKKFQPKYNIKEKDDKSFVNIIITGGDWPKIFVERKRYVESELKNKKVKAKFFGPYTSAKTARLALEIIRKIFGFCADPGSGKECFYHQIGQCPGACSGDIGKAEYKKHIKKIGMFLGGKKAQIIKKIESEMEEKAKNQEFEKAAQLRNQIFALKHIQDIALIGEDLSLISNPLLISPSGRWQVGAENLPPPQKAIPHRIEAYDISNIGGVMATGSMVVFTDGAADKSEYKKFKIKTVKGANDVAMLKEVLKRRFSHNDWEKPNLILIDGGKAQINVAKEVLKDLKISEVEAMSIAKGLSRKGKKIFKTAGAPNLPIKLVENLRDEAHRFAIQYHRLLRGKNMVE
ncbi:MAG: excinuclease ABC subunit UvrC [bacterium]